MNPITGEKIITINGQAYTLRFTWRALSEIEAKYGEPISHWKDIIRAHPEMKHMELVALLKDDYGIGHGHANALVADTLKNG